MDKSMNQSQEQILEKSVNITESVQINESINKSQNAVQRSSIV
jgi:hypothetical protein